MRCYKAFPISLNALIAVCIYVASIARTCPHSHILAIWMDHYFQAETGADFDVRASGRGAEAPHESH